MQTQQGHLVSYLLYYENNESRLQNGIRLAESVVMSYVELVCRGPNAVW
jgi:hypothetical protein